MRIETFAELVVRALGFNNNEKIEERDALGTADLMRARILADILANGGQLTAEYYMRFACKLEFSKERHLHYFYKPCDLLNLPRHGAYQYVGIGGLDESWIPTTFPEVAAYSRLEAGQNGGRTQFIPQGERIYLLNPPVPLPCEIETLLVPSLLWMYENKDNPALMGTDSVSGDVYDQVIQRLQIRRQTPVDNYNNNKPTP